MILRRTGSNDKIRNETILSSKSYGRNGMIGKERKEQGAESPTSSSQFPTVLLIDDDEIGNVPKVPFIKVEPSNEVMESYNDRSLSSLPITPEGIDISSSCTLNNDPVIIDKPFFVMDFLENVDTEDLELVQYMLQKEAITCIKSNVLNPFTKTLANPMMSTTLTNTNNRNQNNSEQFQKHTTACSPPVVSTTPRISGSKKSNTVIVDKTKPELRRSNTFFERSVAIGTRYNAKGVSFASKGDWKKALQYWEDALEIRSQVLGESLDVANTCNNIGIALGKLKRYDEAIKSLQRAINIRVDHYGWNHESIAATLHNMGNVYQQCTQYYCASNNRCNNDDEDDGDDGTPDFLCNAIYCFREAECILENLYGRYNAEVARSLVALGHTYTQAKAPDHARGAYYDALQIFEGIGYTINHPEIRSIVDDLHGLE